MPPSGDDWVKSRSLEQLQEQFGKGIGQLLFDGSITLKDVLKNGGLMPMTLQELARQHPKAWARVVAAKPLSKQAQKVVLSNEGQAQAVRAWLGEKEYRRVAGEIENRRIKKQVEQYGLTQAEAVALRHYTGDGYEMLNKHLNGVIHDESLTPIAGILHNALSKLPDYQGMAIRRTRLPDDVLAKHVVGETIDYPAFTSATFGKKDVVIGEEDDSPHRLLIQAKHAKRIDWISYYQSETEVLFTAPTSFYVLDRRANSSNGLLEIVLYEYNG